MWSGIIIKVIFQTILNILELRVYNIVILRTFSLPRSITKPRIFRNIDVCEFHIEYSGQPKSVTFLDIGFQKNVTLFGRPLYHCTLAQVLIINL